MRVSSLRVGSAGVAILLATYLTACHGGGQATPPLQAASSGSVTQFSALHPAAVNPGSITPAPMTQTALQPASVMLSATPTQRRAMTLGPFTWSQIPGAASQAAYAADGSLWVLSNGPSGPDKYIWHYVSGSWTNIAGLARRIAAAPDGSLYAINSSGGVFHYASGGWTALGGGSSDVAVDVNSAVYVISNGAAADNAIWKFASGSWTQLAGAGARLASAPDSSLYVTTSQGSIFNTSLMSTSWTQCLGAATRIVPLASGAGFIALGSPLDSANGSAIFSFTSTTAGNCASGSYAALNGSGVDVSGYGSNLAVLAPTGAIFTTAGVSASSPTQTPVVASWVLMGPSNVSDGRLPYRGSGKISTIGVSASSPSTIFVGSGLGSGDEGPFSAGGLWKSTDGGTTWASVLSLGNGVVDVIDVDPANANAVIVGTYAGGIFRSTDGGSSWSNVYSAINSAITGIARNGNILYAASASGVLISTDNGASWSPLVSKPNVRIVALTGAGLVAGTGDGTILLVSPQSGATSIVASYPGHDPWSVSVDPGNRLTVAIGIGYNPGFIIVSKDGGQTWSQAAQPQGFVQTVAFSPSTAHRLFVAGGGAMSRSDDFGASWQALSSGNTGDQRTIVFPTNAEATMLVGSDQGAFRSNDGGTTWSALTAAIQNTLTYGVVINGSTIVVAAQDWSPFVSLDSGATWKTNYAGGPFGEAGFVFQNPGQPSICYAYTVVGFQRSTDGCVSFIRNITVTPYTGFGSRMIAVPPNASNTVYLAGIDGVYRSSDGGATMSRTSWPVTSPAVIATDATGSVIAVGSGSGSSVNSGSINISQDGGNTWAATATSGSVTAIAISPLNPQVIVAGAATWGSMAILRSVNGGSTFTPSISGLPSTFPLTPWYPGGATDLLFDKSGLLALSTANGLFLSSDGGVTWQSTPPAGSTSFFSGLLWSGGYLYATTFGRGLVRSDAAIVPQSVYRR